MLRRFCSQSTSSESSQSSWHEALNVVEGAFATRFQLWANQGEWRVLDESASSKSIDSSSGPFELTVDQIQSLLVQQFNADCPAVTTLSKGCNLVIIPVPSGDRVLCGAVAIVSDEDTELLERLAATTMMAVQQQHELSEQASLLGCYADQVSSDFEELVWLRRLTEFLEYCDASSMIDGVLELVLPSLCELIQAESLILIHSEQCTKFRTTEEIEPGRPECHAGQTTYDMSTYHRLVACFGEEARNQTLVRNQLSQDPEFADLPGLRSCVLVAVRTDNYDLGWLLAVNKASLSDDSKHVTWSTSEGEFGTFEASLLAATGRMLASQACNIELFRQKQNLMTGVIRSLVDTIDAKDQYTCGHSDRVARIAKRIARELGWDATACEQSYLAGLLHDVGKIGVPDEVLLKPGPLTSQEFESIKQHPKTGYEILKHLDHLSFVLPGVLHHHETVDGRGYPAQLAGDEIPMLARILAVADAFDAMTSQRPYRDSMSQEEAVSILNENVGKQWDERVVSAFLDAFDDIQAIVAEKTFVADQFASPYPSATTGSTSGMDESNCSVGLADG